MSLKRIPLGHADIVVLALIPVLYLAINPSFGQNQAGDVDTWFYFGLAKSFWHQLPPDFPNDYYETRLPYIIPAAIVFAIPSDRIASVALSYLVYCTCVFSLFYVLSRHVSKFAALLATLLFASDVFFMRTVSWQYVDSGVLAYGSLTFAALTAASVSRHRYAFVALSGFFYASMAMVHLGSVPLGLAVFGYAIYVLNINWKARGNGIALFVCAAIGAASSQLIYGLLNAALYRTSFFFETQQITAATQSLTIAAYFRPLSELLASGWWLTSSIATWLAAVLLIIANFAKFVTPTRFQLYCMWAVFATYSVLFSVDYLRISMFLGRDGLYMSFYLFLSYLFIGSIIPNHVRLTSALVVGCLFFFILFLRFKFAGELSYIPPWAAGIALGVVLAAVSSTQHKAWSAFAVPIAAILVLPITWPFRYEPPIYAARDIVASMDGGGLPYFAFSESDPGYVPVFIGLVGSFTPRAWWIRCWNFPDCPRRSIGQSTMVVLSSNADTARVSSMLSSALPKAKLINARRVKRSNGDFSLYTFFLPTAPILIRGAILPSLVGSVDGSARAATEGTIAGQLTYGPYVTLDPGRYEVTIKYQSEGESGSWDIVSGADVLANGSIPDTRGAVADITVPVDLPNGAVALEARTLYSGHGRLSIRSLEIRQLDAPTRSSNQASP